MMTSFSQTMMMSLDPKKHEEVPVTTLPRTLVIYRSKHSLKIFPRDDSSPSFQLFRRIFKCCRHSTQSSSPALSYPLSLNSLMPSGPGSDDREEGGRRGGRKRKRNRREMGSYYSSKIDSWLCPHLPSAAGSSFSSRIPSLPSPLY